MKHPITICVMLAPLLSGCISTTPPSQGGVRIGEETLNQFKAGVTTESWLLAVLGEPTSTSIVQGVESTRVLRYSTGESSGGLSSLLSGSGSRNTAVVYFIVTDGLVTRFWADRAVDHDLMGKPVELPAWEKQK